MADNETGISPNTPMQDLIGQMNYQAAQSAVGLNLSKQMSNQLSAINMNIGKTTAAMNRVDSNIGNLLNMQKSMNMNIGKVNASVNALGKKYDDTNKILSDILKSASKGGAGDQYQSLENKLETKDVSNNIQSMTDSLKSIDETLKKIGGLSSSSSSTPSPTPTPQSPSWMNWGKMGLTALGVGLTYSGYNTLSNNQSPNLFGDEKTGWMGSRASGYAQTILGGALTGTMGGPFGMALGAGAGILTARNTDPQLKNYNGVFGPLKNALPQSSDPAYVKQLNDSYEKTTKFKWTRDGKYWIKDTQRGDWAEISREQWEAGVNQAKTLGIKPDIEIEPFTANKDAGPVWERYGRVGPNTTAMDMAVAGDIMNRNANKPMPSPSSAVSGTNDSKEFTGQPPKTIEKKTETEPVSASPVDDSSEPFLPVPYLPSDSSTASYVEPKDSILPEVPPTGLVVGTMGAKEALDQQQATIDQKSKDMTKSTLSYEATDVLYKATNIKFEASSIQFTGAMGGGSAGGGSVGSGPYDNGGGPGNSFNNGEGSQAGNGSGGSGGGGSEKTGRTLSPEEQSAADSLQKDNVFKAAPGKPDPLGGYSEDDLRKKNIVTHTNNDGTKVYTYAPGGIGGHADRIGGSGATQSSSVGSGGTGSANDSPATKMFNSIMSAETGGKGDPLSEKRFIRTTVSAAANRGRVSSAYGPVQMTKSYLEDFKYGSKENKAKGVTTKDYDVMSAEEKKYLDGLIDQGKKMLSAGEHDPVYGLGGKGTMGDTEEERKLYASVAQRTMVRLAKQSKSYQDFRHRYRGEHDGGYFAKIEAAARAQGTTPEELFNQIKNMPIEQAGSWGAIPSGKAPNVGEELSTLDNTKNHAEESSYSMPDFKQPDIKKTMMEKNSAAIERTEALRREQARVENRSHSDKKREDARVQQMKENRENHAPKNPVPSKRRELDSVLVRHNDWWKNWSATA